MVGTTFFHTSGKMRGSPQDLTDLISILREYTYGVKDAYFMNLSFVSGSEIREARELTGEVLDAFVRGVEEISFSALGPFGKHEGLNDTDAFRKMAEAAPGAWFEVSVDGYDSYTPPEFHCCLKNGILSVDTSKKVTVGEREACRTEKMKYNTGV